MSELQGQEVIAEKSSCTRELPPVPSREPVTHADASPRVETVRGRIEQLADSIKALNESPSHVSFWMSVDVNTAKASLVPVPTYENMVKLKDNFDNLPKRVRTTMKKNISEQDFQSFQAILEAFREDGQKSLAVPETHETSIETETAAHRMGSDTEEQEQRGGE